MRIAVLHHEVAGDASPDDRDVLVQAEAISAALKRLGHEPLPLVCGLNLAALKMDLLRSEADAVFNLVESLDGADRLMHLPLAVIESLGIPFTGCPAEAIVLSNHKPLAKRLMRSAGLPTPDWWELAPGERDLFSSQETPLREGDRALIKAVGDHASLGLDDGSVVAVRDEQDLHERLRQRQAEMGRPVFAERFIDGREFNLSLLAGSDGVAALPCAEIDFSAFPPDKPRIVGYAAKWHEETFDYQATPRRFDFPPHDQPLLELLVQQAEACWKVFGLSGYARVDFRVDIHGLPLILEVNANPCLSPDAGFAAAVDRAGWTFDEAIESILHAALKRK